MIKSTTIYIKGANKTKQELLGVFCSEYRNAVAFYVKMYFSKKFPNISSFSDAEALKTPKFYPFDIAPTCKLSARALVCAKTQAMGLIAAATKKQSARVHMLKKLQKEGRWDVSSKWYVDYIERFYTDKQFNRVYDDWIFNNKDKYRKPSLDHIIPKAKGGTNDLDNLQFLTWFENRCKNDMDQREWDDLKSKILEYFI